MSYQLKASLQPVLLKHITQYKNWIRDTKELISRLTQNIKNLEDPRKPLSDSSFSRRIQKNRIRFFRSRKDECDIDLIDLQVIKCELEAIFDKGYPNYAIDKIITEYYEKIETYENLITFSARQNQHEIDQCNHEITIAEATILELEKFKNVRNREELLYKILNGYHKTLHNINNSDDLNKLAKIDLGHSVCRNLIHHETILAKNADPIFSDKEKKRYFQLFVHYPEDQKTINLAQFFEVTTIPRVYSPLSSGAQGSPHHAARSASPDELSELLDRMVFTHLPSA